MKTGFEIFVLLGCYTA